MALGTGLPKRVYKRLPRRLPRSLGFKRYCLAFDGVDDYVGVPHSASISIVGKGLTVEALTWSEDYTFNDGIVLNKEHNYRLHQYGSTYSCMLELEASGWKEFDSGVPIPTSQWVHYVLTYDGSYVRLFGNGELVGKWPMNENIVDSVSYDLAIGRYKPDQSGFEFKGCIAFVRIYNRPLSQAEIKRNMLEYHNPVKDGLVLWLHDKIVGDTWYDESGLGNDGTIYGAAMRELAMWEIRSELGL